MNFEKLWQTFLVKKKREAKRSKDEMEVITILLGGLAFFIATNPLQAAKQEVFSKMRTGTYVDAISIFPLAASMKQVNMQILSVLRFLFANLRGVLGSSLACFICMTNFYYFFEFFFHSPYI